MKTFDNSYDREQAVTLAMKLAGKKGKVNLPEPKAPAGSGAVGATPIEKPAVGFRDEGVFRDEVWRQLLGWAVAFTGAGAAFVCDGSGLVIAEKGERGDIAEGLPSGVVSALSGFKRCSREGNIPQQVSAHVDGIWVTALTLSDGTPGLERDGMVVGLVGATRPDAEAVAQIGAFFREKVAEI